MRMGAMERARLRQHAQATVAADRAEDAALVERVARDLRTAAQADAGSMLLNEFGGWGEDEDFAILARAAIRAMGGGE